jgi:hypothetical protein
MIALLLWVRLLFFTACAVLVGLYLWIGYQTGRTE